MCDLEPLFFNNDGYVVYCKHCGYYQIGFGTTLLNLSPHDFATLFDMLKNDCYEVSCPFDENAKNIVIPTPSQEVYMIFTMKEAARLLAILEEADNEMKAVQLLNLFH